MRNWVIWAMAALLLPGTAWAGETADNAVQHLYAGTAADALPKTVLACDTEGEEACFAAGLLQLVVGYEGLAKGLYRYGATMPGLPAAAMLLGLGGEGGDNVPANPNPEKLSYDALRQLFEGFLVDLDTARGLFQRGGDGGDYVVHIDPLQVRIDFDGDGQIAPTETLAEILQSLGAFSDLPTPAPTDKAKSKHATQTVIGFDRADAFWFAGYSQIVGAPFDWLLAHDFSGLYNAYLHHSFPRAGLPMQPYSRGGTLFMDPESDSAIADIIAAIHTLDFPVIQPQRLADVRLRLLDITRLSRLNWQAILSETDDDRELVPSPRQTSLLPGHEVTDEVVTAWHDTLDRLDAILDGELLLPHWRFAQGFDLKAYFDNAPETDLVLLLTGLGALPYLKDGPIADADSFAAANRVFGDNWLNYALWFN